MSGGDDKHSYMFHDIRELKHGDVVHVVHGPDNEFFEGAVHLVHHDDFQDAQHVLEQEKEQREAEARAEAFLAADVEYQASLRFWETTRDDRTERMQVLMYLIDGHSANEVARHYGVNVWPIDALLKHTRAPLELRDVLYALREACQ